VVKSIRGAVPALSAGPFSRTASRTRRARFRAPGAPQALSGPACSSSSQVVTPHMFRHATATELLARGASIDVVKELLGHASIRSTEAYLHPDADAQRAAVDRLGPLGFGEATP
jgi:integrase